MYAFLSGKLVFKSPTQVYLDVNGVGYLIHISLHTYSLIEPLDQAKLYTHLHVTDDALTLWGFYEESEKEIFRLLISVSGIGPNTARIVLSSMTARDIRTAILTDNDIAFKNVKGIGPKTAKRIILDLRDKMLSVEVGDTVELSPVADNAAEAINALMALGFQRAKVAKVLDSLKGAPDQSVEGLIKQALQRLT